MGVLAPEIIQQDFLLLDYTQKYSKVLKGYVRTGDVSYLVVAMAYLPLA